MKLPFLRRRPKYRNLLQEKKTLIDFAFQQMEPPPRSFADLGGVWNVDGAYTFYTLDTFPVDRAVLVDSAISDAVTEASPRSLNSRRAVSRMCSEVFTLSVRDCSCQQA